MEINKIITDYLIESKIYKKTATALLNALNHQKIYTVADLNKTTNIKLINYFKIHTRKKNSSINDVLEFLYKIIRYYNINTKLSKLKKLSDDTLLFKPILEKDLSSILKYVNDLDKNKNTNLYTKLMVYLFLDTDIQSNKLLNIKRFNIDSHEKSIYWETTKNGKPRYAYYSELSKDTLEKVLKDNGNMYLFFNNLKNKRFSYKFISYHLDKIKKDLNIKILHAHRFRKTFATNLLKNGCDLTIIQKLLGHSDIKMTMIYLQIYDSFVKNEYQKYQPKYSKE
ncbi:MAG: site-specific integrase [Acholeplasmataceae bacterium]